MKRRTLLSAAVGSPLLSELAFAQEKYPSKLISWICPYAVGGGADNRSRKSAKLMRGILGKIDPE